MLTGSIPPTGIPLPFISAGGTSLSVFMAGVGVLCNVANYTEVSHNLGMNVFSKVKKKKLKKT